VTVITKAQRAELIDTLTLHFGAKLDQKKNHGVSSAFLLRDALRKDFKRR
jgi:hypothetical protein